MQVYSLDFEKTIESNQVNG